MKRFLLAFFVVCLFVGSGCSGSDGSDGSDNSTDLDVSEGSRTIDVGGSDAGTDELVIEFVDGSTSQVLVTNVASSEIDLSGWRLCSSRSSSSCAIITGDLLPAASVSVPFAATNFGLEDVPGAEVLLFSIDGSGVSEVLTLRDYAAFDDSAESFGFASDSGFCSPSCFW